MMELVITFLLSVLYGIVISVGYGKRLDDNIATRPIVVVGGVLIVIGGYAWSKGSLELLEELVIWFAVAGMPMAVRCGLIFVKQDEEAEKKLEQAQQQIERLGDSL